MSGIRHKDAGGRMSSARSRVRACRQSIRSASSLKPADWSAPEPAWRIPIAKLASMPAKSSAAPNPTICQSATDQVRVGDQSQDRQGARFRHSTHPSPRSDEVID